MAVRDFPPRPQGATPNSVPYQNWLDALGQRQNIDLQQELTSVDSADELLIFDASETGPVKTKKATVSNVLALVTSGDMSYADSRFKVGSFTRDISIASGTQSITGVGFQPRLLFVMAGINATTAANFGYDTGSGAVCMTNGYIFTPGWWFITNSYSIQIIANAAATSYYLGAVSSMDVDGFTYSWTKAGTPTGTISIYYAAFR